MFGAHRRGFAWKEVVAVLHMTRAVARGTFWREIKRSRSKKGESPPPAIVIQGETDSDTLKRSKRREHLDERGGDRLSSRFVSGMRC